MYVVIAHDHEDYDSFALCLTEDRKTASDSIREYIPTMISLGDKSYFLNLITMDNDREVQTIEGQAQSVEEISNDLADLKDMILQAELFDEKHRLILKFITEHHKIT